MRSYTTTRLIGSTDLDHRSLQLYFASSRSTLCGGSVNSSMQKRTQHAHVQNNNSLCWAKRSTLRLTWMSLTICQFFLRATSDTSCKFGMSPCCVEKLSSCIASRSHFRACSGSICHIPTQTVTHVRVRVPKKK